MRSDIALNLVWGLQAEGSSDRMDIKQGRIIPQMGAMISVRVARGERARCPSQSSGRLQLWYCRNLTFKDGWNDPRRTGARRTGKGLPGRGIAGQRHGGIQDKTDPGSPHKPSMPGGERLMRRVTDTHTWSPTAADFLTFFDAGTTVRFLGVLLCILSIKDLMGVPTLKVERTFFSRANTGARREGVPHPCSWPGHLT